MAVAGAQWAGTPSIKGSSEPMRMALLTFSLIGLQFTWGMEMTYCTPYLLQLGLTKSKLSLVWIAGPLSGLIMQPIVGIMADKSKSKYGRRRPVMVVGSVLVGFCLILLGWTGEIIGAFVQDKELKRELTIVLAVFSIYALDFAINAVQSSCRSLIVDTLPVSKQQLGSAWASRMVAVGHLVGYGIGAMDLSVIFGKIIGDTQFKQLTVIAALALLVAVGVTSWAVTERVLISDGLEEQKGNPVVNTLSIIFRTTRDLPPRIQAICNIQFWSWIAWFPFLFYSSTWVGETYLRYDAPEAVRTSPDSLSTIGRVGSMTLILFSIVTFIGSVSLPWIVQSPDTTSTGRFTPRPPPRLVPLLHFLPKRKPTLLTAWTAGHLLFTTAMLFAPFIASLHAASFIVATCGLPWALASWAPFTFMGQEINRLPSPALHHRSASTLSEAAIPLEPSSYGRMPNSLDLDVNNSPESTVLHLRQDSLTSTSTLPDRGSQTGELAGIYLGILNLYTTLPQFVATGISTVVFAIFEPGKTKAVGDEGAVVPEGTSGIAVCLFIGALASVVAAWSTRRFARMGDGL
ncbi:proteinral alpha-glucoside permease [Sphaceloma murrayae]|uniref:Proteinral alpha-glucoside permease n=1 Tax=Sphaceloma murrayae TaxID=2082308 RepID=A0A2K1QL07_9PEZI|nr:proteinral alpha-glucoside permease [Sphaceloma murrayae]